MNITPHHINVIKECAKDDQAYEQLIDLFESVSDDASRYRQVFENNQAMKLLIDPATGRIVDANPAAIAFYGYPDLTSMHIHDINIRPEQEVDTYLARAEAEEQHLFQFRHRLASGEIRDVSVFSSPLETPDGRVLFSILVDITEQTGAGRRYRLLADHIHDMVVLHNLDGTIRYASPSCERLLGYTPEELVALPPNSIVHPDDLDVIENAVDTASPRVYRMRHKSGTYVWTESEIAPVFNEDGDLDCLVSSSRDITERVDTEEALRRSEQAFRAIVENSPDSVQRLARDGTHLYVNPAYAARLGMTPAEAIGVTNDDIGVPPDLQERFDATREHVFNTGEPTDLHFRFPAQVGGVRDYHAHLVPEFDADGNVEALLAIVRDVTEINEATEALRESERRYRTIAANFPNGLVALYDQDLRYTLADGQGLADLGMTSDDLVGKRLRDIFPPEIYERDEPQMRAALLGEPTDELVTLGDQTFRVMTLPVRDDDGDIVSGMVMSQNITPLVRAQEALRESERRYRTIAAHFPNGIIGLYDHDLRYTLFDGESRARSDLTSADYIGKRLRDIFPPEVYERDEPKLRAALEGEPTDTVVQHGDETFRVLTLPVRDDDGDIVSGMVMSQNITPLVQAEANLREMNQRYDDLVRNIPALAFRCRLTPAGDFRFDYLSPRCEEMTGYTVEEGLENSLLLTGIFSPEVQRHIGELMAHSAETLTPLEFEGPATINGETRWVRLESRPHRAENGDIVWDGLHSDITERKRTENALLAAREATRRVLQQIPVGIQTFDTDGLCTDANRAHCEIFGVRRFDIVGHYNIFDDPLAASMDTQNGARRAIRGELVQLGDLTFDFTTGHPRHVDTTQPPKMINVTMVPIFDEDNQVVSIVGVNVDVTERVAAQQREIDFLLERERAGLMASFLENAAHEFRTPLATIGTSAHLMARSDDPDRRRQKAAQIQGLVQRVTHLVDTGLLMARLENRDPAQIRPLDMGDMLAGVCNDLRAEYGDTPELLFTEPPSLPQIAGDEDVLYAAFLQIIDNAMRFTPDGTVQVRVEAVEDNVQISVTDTGVGMTGDTLAHIFESFWRLDDAHTTPGLGLGLPIARRAIEGHGGTVLVESVFGSGTTVTVTLPT